MESFFKLLSSRAAEFVGMITASGLSITIIADVLSVWLGIAVLVLTVPYAVNRWHLSRVELKLKRKELAREEALETAER